LTGLLACGLLGLVLTVLASTDVFDVVRFDIGTIVTGPTTVPRASVHMFTSDKMFKLIELIGFQIYTKYKKSIGGVINLKLANLNPAFASIATNVL
tara:strand:+ start:174 stop:461 length:288 start_codon:yes stop_codon:yes gene_type:complete